MEVIKEKIRYPLQFFFDKGENTSQAAEIVNGVYGADMYNFGFVNSIQAILMKENVDKITEIFEVDRQVSIRSIAQELKIDHKAVLSHLRKI